MARLTKARNPFSKLHVKNQTHPFDAAIHLEPHGNGRWCGHTHEAYGNIVGPFGGTTTAAALAAVPAHPARQGEPIAKPATPTRSSPAASPKCHTPRD